MQKYSWSGQNWSYHRRQACATASQWRAAEEFVSTGCYGNWVLHVYAVTRRWCLFSRQQQRRTSCQWCHPHCVLGGARAPDPREGALLGACLGMPRFARGRNFYGQCESRRCVKFMHTPFRVAYSWPLCANMTSSMKPEVIRYRNAAREDRSTAAVGNVRTKIWWRLGFYSGRLMEDSNRED